MFKKLLLTFFLLFSSFITIYPSTKENTKLFDYFYNLEKIFSRNSVVKSKNISRKVKTLCRIDTKNELEYYKNGGILQYVLRNMI